MNHTSTHYKYIIIGAGIAGLSAIKKIREHNTQDRILLIHNEDRLPYKRTKINKHIAVGFSKNDFSLNSKGWYEENSIDLLYDEVSEINKELKTICSEQGIYSYYKLLIATGSKPNIPDIKGINKQNVNHVHNAKEVDQLLLKKNKAEHFLIIGGGVEGIETADQLARLGKKVSIIQRSKNPLKQLFPDEISQHIYHKIKLAGIDYFEDEEVSSVHHINDKFETTTTRQQLIADEIIFCSGSKPNIKLAINSDLNTNKGILVDSYLRTSDEHIFAAGDIAEHNNGFISGLWHPAEYQGYAAGENMIGRNKPYSEAPYRLKTEVFDGFYFSANFTKCQNKNIQIVKEKFGNIYRELYLSNDVLCGLVMMNDKKRSKIYQKSIAEKWSLSKFNKALPAL